MYVIGNVNQHNLLEIWNGERMKELRRLHVNKERNKVRLCRDCPTGYPRWKAFMHYLWSKSHLPERVENDYEDRTNS